MFFYTYYVCFQHPRGMKLKTLQRYLARQNVIVDFRNTPFLRMTICPYAICLSLSFDLRLKIVWTHDSLLFTRFVVSKLRRELESSCSFV